MAWRCHDRQGGMACSSAREVARVQLLHLALETNLDYAAEPHDFDWYLGRQLVVWCWLISNGRNPTIPHHGRHHWEGFSIIELNVLRHEGRACFWRPPVLGDSDIKGCLSHLASKRDVVHCVGNRRVPCFVRSPHAVSVLKAPATYLPLLRVNGSFLPSCSSSSSTTRWSSSECTPRPRSLPSLPLRKAADFPLRSGSVSSHAVCSCLSRVVTPTCSQPCQKCSGSTKSGSCSTVQKQAYLPKFGTGRRLGTTRHRSSRSHGFHLNFRMGLGATSPLSTSSHVDAESSKKELPSQCYFEYVEKTLQDGSLHAETLAQAVSLDAEAKHLRYRDVLRRRYLEIQTAADKYHASYL